MEKRLIKKDVLAGIVGKIAGDVNLFAPVKDEDNVLFEQVKDGATALSSYKNTKNAPKAFFFPRSCRIVANQSRGSCPSINSSLQMYVRWTALASSMLRFNSGLIRWLLPSVALKMAIAFWAWASRRLYSSWIMPLG